MDLASTHELNTVRRNKGGDAIPSERSVIPLTMEPGVCSCTVLCIYSLCFPSMTTSIALFGGITFALNCILLLSIYPVLEGSVFYIINHIIYSLSWATFLSKAPRATTYTKPFDFCIYNHAVKISTYRSRARPRGRHLCNPNR